MLNPLQIANYFIGKSIQTGNELTPMKLVKLVYIAHGWYLGLSSKPLVNEAVLAWDYGPVIESLYRTFRKYGRNQVTSPENFYGVTQTIENAQIEKFLEKIWQVYGKFSGLQLSALTHQPDTPWSITYHQRGKNALISNDLIEQHYKVKANAGKPATPA